MKNAAGEPIGKKLRFFSTSACFSNYLTNKFGVCSCVKHADFNTAVWKETGYYNKELSKVSKRSRTKKNEHKWNEKLAWNLLHVLVLFFPCVKEFLAFFHVWEVSCCLGNR